MPMAVDLPQPDGPTTVTNSPSATSRLNRSSAVKREPSGAAKSRDTASKEIFGLPHQARSCQAVRRRSSATTARSMARPSTPMAIRLTKMVGRS